MLQEPSIGATYARVSTLRQKDGISLEQQESEMLSYATSEQIEVPASYRFKEQASGYSDMRKYYDEIRALIRNREITDLIVYSSDRHTRDPIHGDIFRAELRCCSITLHIVSEGGEVDIETPMGQFMRRQVDNFNWLWGEMIKQAIQRNKTAYTAKGIPYVQGFAKYGLERVGTKEDVRMVKVDDEATTVLNMYTWYDQGLSVDRIGELLRGTPAPGEKVGNAKRKRAAGEWARSTIYSILRDPIYRGVYYANRAKMVYDDRTGKNTKRQNLTSEEGQHPINVPAIVPDELWNRVQARLVARRKASSHDRGKYQYLITARSTCRHCGASVTGNTGSNKIGYYRCNRRYSRAYVDKGCDFKPERVDLTDTAVWNRLKELLKKPEALRALLLEAQEAQKKQVTDLESTIDNISRIVGERRRQFKGFTKAIVAEYSQETPNQDIIASLRLQADDIIHIIEGLETEKARCLARLNQKVISPTHIENSVAYAESIADQLDNAPFEVKREAIEHFDMHFEFERDDNDQVIVHVHWMLWEFDLLVGQASRHTPSESILSESHKSPPSCGR